jgi:protocatechuate 3,4-dioxygenase beta subunit
MRDLTEDNMTDAALGRIAPDADARLRAIMTSLIRHAHGFVRDVQLTPQEWEAGVGFLTELANWCDDKRQEVILLSDTLGVSMLVDAIANRCPSGETESTVLGPFYRPSAAAIANGGDLAPGKPGDRLDIDGHVLDADGRPVAGATVDVWHTSPDGLYDSQIGDGAEYSMRGQLHTDADGRFWFRTVKPASYPVPNDGPVGRMLRAMGRHPMRPAHVHFIIVAPGYRTLVTQLFVEGDQYLDSDAVFGVKDSLVVDYKNVAGAGEHPRYRVSYDFRLGRLAASGAAGRPAA